MRPAPDLHWSTKNPGGVALTVVAPSQNTSDIELQVVGFVTPSAPAEQIFLASSAPGAQDVQVRPGETRTFVVNRPRSERPFCKFVVRLRLLNATGAATAQLQAVV